MGWLSAHNFSRHSKQMLHPTHDSPLAALDVDLDDARARALRVVQQRVERLLRHLYAAPDTRLRGQL